MKKQLKNNKSGFTLIELVIVVIILAILASVALPRLTRQIGNSQAAEAINTMGAVVRAAETCYQMNNNSFTNCTTWGANGMPADPGGAGKRFNYALTNANTAAANGLPTLAAGDFRVRADQIGGAAADTMAFDIIASTGVIIRTAGSGVFNGLNTAVFNQ